MNDEARRDADQALMGLMEAYQGGDVTAFERLYSALAPPLLGYLRALTQDASLADDVLQDTFLQMHRARHTFRPGHPVKPWAFAIARNVFLMHRRARGRRERREVLADDELPQWPVRAAEAEIVDRETLLRGVAVVGRERCEELLLHHLAGLSFREIAGVLGISEGAAKVRAHRAMAELKRVLRRDRG